MQQDRRRNRRGGIRGYPDGGVRPEQGHLFSDIAPGRKTDPGPAFDWQRLRAASITC